MEREARRTLVELPEPSVVSACCSGERKFRSFLHETVIPRRPEFLSG